MQQVTDLVEFAPLARQVATRMIPAGQAVLGMDRDDYAMDFAFAAADAREKFCERFGWCTPAERRYVRKAVWNKARDARKRVSRHMELFDLNAQVPEQVDDFEARMEARDLVRRLERRLGSDDMTLLTNGLLGQLCSGPVPPAERQRFTRVRLEARRFLEKACHEVAS